MSLDQIKIQKRNRMAEIETAVLRAVEYEKSGHFAEDQIAALVKIGLIVGSPGQPIDQAAALQKIGRIQQVLEDLGEPRRKITEYESLKKSLAEMNEPKE